jgi:hypothetical protein
MLRLFYPPKIESSLNRKLDGARTDVNAVGNTNIPPRIDSRSFTFQQISILTELSRLILCGDVLLYYYTEAITELFRLEKYLNRRLVRGQGSIILIHVPQN